MKKGKISAGIPKGYGENSKKWFVLLEDVDNNDVGCRIDVNGSSASFELVEYNAESKFAALYPLNEESINMMSEGIKDSVFVTVFDFFVRENLSPERLKNECETYSEWRARTNMVKRAIKEYSKGKFVINKNP